MLTNSFLTPAAFATIARTSKRTIMWYVEKGLLKPAKINSTGYHFFTPHQVLDYQAIHLLVQLGFSLEEIALYLKRGKKLEELLVDKRSEIKTKIHHLKQTLTNLDNYYRNRQTNGTLVNPTIKYISATSIYYLDKTGPYAKIKDYCLELKSYLTGVPKNATYLSLFIDPDYRPNAHRMFTSIVKTPLMHPKSTGSPVKQMVIPSFTALAYTHRGSGTLVSYLWQELAKYRQKQNIPYNDSLSFIDLEIYQKTSLNGHANEDNMVFELLLPIKL